jgi:hypothetical protein
MERKEKMVSTLYYLSQSPIKNFETFEMFLKKIFFIPFDWKRIEKELNDVLKRPPLLLTNWPFSLQKELSISQQDIEHVLSALIQWSWMVDVDFFAQDQKNQKQIWCESPFMSLC